MKSGLMLIAVIALLLAPGHSSAKGGPDEPSDTHETVQDNGRKMMEDDANASAQAVTDMSYGGVPETGTSSSGTRDRSCKAGSQCASYRGR
ncbi:hypothetical protein DID96_29255 [Burkholderia sp. Bp8963]|uniref:hypothetical protein n=1 Tax=Burkholderia sp. Bp8963 TaxID=2184547 RepID=UPI000F5AA59B|nr:hypothetical protein [Burkholderia sp. Bp8963]RQS63632.1 hypothetical protein DID96_29255 [Burkholderia sp. Bp8963]